MGHECPGAPVLSGSPRLAPPHPAGTFISVLCSTLPSTIPSGRQWGVGGRGEWKASGFVPTIQVLTLEKGHVSQQICCSTSLMSSREQRSHLLIYRNKAAQIVFVEPAGVGLAGITCYYLLLNFNIFPNFPISYCLCKCLCTFFPLSPTRVIAIWKS